MFTDNDFTVQPSYPQQPSLGLLADDCISRNIVKVFSLFVPCYWFRMDWLCKNRKSVWIKRPHRAVQVVISRAWFSSYYIPAGHIYSHKMAAENKRLLIYCICHTDISWISVWFYTINVEFSNAKNILPLMLNLLNILQSIVAFLFYIFLQNSRPFFKNLLIFGFSSQWVFQREIVLISMQAQMIYIHIRIIAQSVTIQLLARTLHWQLYRSARSPH